jgi:hypothetical protein
VTALLADSEAQRFLGVNRFDGVLWFNKESFEQLLWWMLWLAVVDAWSDAQRPAGVAVAQVAERYRVVEVLQRAGDASEYRVEKLLALVEAEEESRAVDS